MPSQADTPLLTERFDDALAYARDLHNTQTRKGTGTPYFAHLMGVSSLVLEHGGDEDQAIAGLLHDAAEDQGGAETLGAIRAKFGDGVAEIVEHCTDSWVEPKPPWRERKEAYIASLADKPQRSLLVSIADKLHNCRAIAADYAAIGPGLWDRFTGGREGTVWYYRALAARFEQLLPSPLTAEFVRAVRALTRRVIMARGTEILIDKLIFETDPHGRTALFDMVSTGDLEAVKRTIFALSGTGLSCQRLALIERRDAGGNSAIEIARQAGHGEIAELLESERLRMEFFE